MSDTPDFSQAHAAAIEVMKGQLLIVLVKRLGGKVTIPVTEIDGTGLDMLAMRLDPDTRAFVFEVRKKA